MADSTITRIERLVVEKRAELERVQADLAALERTLALLRYAAIPPQVSGHSQVERPTTVPPSGEQLRGQDVRPPRGLNVPRREGKEEPIPAVIVQVLENAGRAMTPIEIDRAIRATGRTTMHKNAVTSHLSRLVKPPSPRIKRTGPSLYAAIGPENRHDVVEGNGQLDWDRQAPPGEEDMTSSTPSDITDKKSNLEQQNASPGKPGEAF